MSSSINTIFSCLQVFQERIWNPEWVEIEWVAIFKCFPFFLEKESTKVLRATNSKIHYQLFPPSWIILSLQEYARISMFNNFILTFLPSRNGTSKTSQKELFIYILSLLSHCLPSLYFELNLYCVININSLLEVIKYK